MLLWDEGIPEQKVDTVLAETKTTSYIKNSGIDSGVRYHFAIQAVNKCGRSPVTKKIDVIFETEPHKMDPVTTTSSTSDCGYQISWTPPSDGGLVITGYRIEVRDRLGRWVHIPDCGVNPDETSCPLSETRLKNRPFVFRQRDLVIGRAQAINSLGGGLWSDPNTSTAAEFKRGRPSKVRGLTYSKLATTSVSIRW